MAQLVAHLLCKQGVRGSSPLGSTEAVTVNVAPWTQEMAGWRSFGLSGQTYLTASDPERTIHAASPGG